MSNPNEPPCGRADECRVTTNSQLCKRCANEAGGDFAQLIIEAAQKHASTMSGRAIVGSPVDNTHKLQVR